MDLDGSARQLTSQPGGSWETTDLILPRPARVLEPVPGSDDIRLERCRAGAAMKPEEQAAGVAEHGAVFVASPHRGGLRLAILADDLCGHL